MTHSCEKLRLCDIGGFGRLTRVDEIRLRALPFGNVAKNSSKENFTTVANLTHCQFDGKLGSIFAHCGKLAAADADDLRIACFHKGCDVCGMARMMRFRHQDRQISAEHLLRCVAEDALSAGAPLLDPALGVDRHDAIGKCVKNCLKAGATAFGNLFEQFALADLGLEPRCELRLMPANVATNVIAAIRTEIVVISRAIDVAGEAMWAPGHP